jgi:hypothetical protein
MMKARQFVLRNLVLRDCPGDGEWALLLLLDP